MGGIGSGRRLYDTRGSKATTCESLPLDVRAMHRAGYLKRGAYSTWRWWRGSDQNKARGSSIGCLSLGELIGVQLIYSHRGEDVRQTIALDWTPCHFGGARPWWTCPSCARRAAVIYSAGKYFACRHCCGLCYGTQKENAGDRARSRAWKIRQHLGQKSGGHAHPLPDKPTGMHWETYWRLCMKCHEAEMQGILFISRWLDGIEAQL